MARSQHPVFTMGNTRSIKIFFNDEAVDALEGQTVAAALVNSGHWLFGKSRSKLQPRGMFCSRGWCASCYVTYGGKSRVLSCMLRAEEGMKIYSQVGDPTMLEAEDDRERS